MIYLVCTLLFSLLMLLYFKIADKYNIVDRPNERSSHTIVTLRGGGIVFWFASLFYFILNFRTNYLFFTAITLVSFVSFYDDIKSLPSKTRFLIQLIAVGVIFYDLNIFNLYPPLYIVCGFVISIGIINAFNFMDGINGISGLYSLIVLFSLSYTNLHIKSFIDNDFLVFPMIACLVFLFFNYRKRARCFAGDIGSISIAFWIIYALTKLIIETNSLVWLLFLALYGVDTVCTIIHRLVVKQNIFQPHRMHFYQILSNECKVDHRIVSLVYAIVQGLISFYIIYLYRENSFENIASIIILLSLLLLYLLKFVVIKKINHKNDASKSI